MHTVPEALAMLKGFGTAGPHLHVLHLGPGPSALSLLRLLASLTGLGVQLQSFSHPQEELMGEATEFLVVCLASGLHLPTVLLAPWLQPTLKMLHSLYSVIPFTECSCDPATWSGL